MYKEPPRSVGKSFGTTGKEYESMQNIFSECKPAAISPAGYGKSKAAELVAWNKAKPSALSIVTLLI